MCVASFCVISVFGLACILDRGPVFVTEGGKVEGSNQAQGTRGQKVRLYSGILKPGLLQSQPHLVCRHQHIFESAEFYTGVSSCKAPNKRISETDSFIVHTSLGLVHIWVISDQ